MADKKEGGHGPNLTVIFASCAVIAVAIAAAQIFGRGGDRRADGGFRPSVDWSSRDYRQSPADIPPPSGVIITGRE